MAGVDLSKARAALGKRRKQLDPDADFVVTVDRCALRKEWSKTPSYWISIVHCQQTKLFQVYREWKWFKSVSNEWIEGKASLGDPTDNQDCIRQTYGEALGVMTSDEKGYVLVTRNLVISPSPAEHYTLNMLLEGKTKQAKVKATHSQKSSSKPKKKAEKPKKKPTMKRKGDHDWW